MQNTFKLAALALTVSLGIASCGGQTQTPPDTGSKPNPGPVAEDPGTLPPVTGGTIAKPADAVAANEFVIRGERAKAMAQSLGLSTSAGAGVKTVQALGLRPLAQEDELRVLVAVTRAKTGTNAGKKRATATFVWGNQSEKILPASADKNQPGITLDIYPQADETQKITYKGSLNLQVKSPDFQAKTTKSSDYVNDTGAMCAQLVVNLTTAPNTGSSTGYSPLNFNTSDSPMEVCEGEDERNAEKVALEKASRGLLYDYDSYGKTPFDFRRSGSGQTITALPSAAEFLNIGGNILREITTGTVQTLTLDDFFAPLTVMPAGDSKDWTPEQKAQATLARKYENLKKQFGYYYRETRVYTVENGSRVDIFILGLNGWGVGGLHTIQFPLPAPVAG